MDIVIYDGSAFEAWNPETIEENGAGGSELMLADLTRELVRRGHRVRVYIKTTPETEGTFGGVEWRPIHAVAEVDVCDVLVAWRTPEIIRSNYAISAKATIFVATDSFYGRERMTAEKVAAVDKFVVMSNWHKKIFVGHDLGVAFPDEAVRVIRTSVDGELFDSFTGPFRVPRRLIHTSAPNRSLRKAIEAMPAIRKAVPGAELHVYHGFLTLEMFAEHRGDDGMKRDLALLKALILDNHKHGVRYFDRVNRRQMYEALLGAHVWVYPTHVAETSCMAAQEAIAAGCNIVAFELGALGETIGAHGTLLPYEANSKQYEEAVVRALRTAAPPGVKHGAVPTISEMVDQYERLFLEEMSERSPSTRGAPTPVAEGIAAKDAEGNVAPVVRKRAGIALAMIVKNEGTIIAETLRRVRPLIDGYHIIDTGSSDDTIEVMRRALDGLPGTIEERPWVHFKHNRTELLRNARASEHNWEWLLTLDADCHVEASFDNAALKKMLDDWGVDQVLVPGRAGDIRYDKLFMLRADLDWYYDIPTHEWIFCREMMHWHRVLSGIVVYETGASHRRASGKKFTEDIELLTAYLADPSAPHRPRATFYLAQSYRDSGQHERALEFYTKRVAMVEGVHEERFNAAIEAARALETLQKDPEEAYKKAIVIRPSRIEGHYGLGHHYRLRGRYQEAVEALRRAVALPVTTDELFVNMDVYEWRAKDDLATALSWIDDVGARAEAATLFRELLDSGKLPEVERARVQGNEKLCLDLVQRHRATARRSPSVRSVDGQWVVVSPSSKEFPVAHALDDVADMLLGGLKEAGLEATRSSHPVVGATNLILGAHLGIEASSWFSAASLSRMKSAGGRMIIYQTEVWSSSWWTQAFWQRMRSADEVWDYSLENIRKYEFRPSLPAVRRVPLGPSQSVLVSPGTEEEKTVDVLFFGSMNARRLGAMERLRDRGLVVEVLEGFGDTRAAAIRRAKVVLNMHYYEGAPYEQARLVPLLASGIPVVSEVSSGDEWIASAILHKVEYEHLADECMVLVEHAELRRNAGEHARRMMEGHPMRERILSCLDGVKAVVEPPAPPPESDLGAALPPKPLKLNLGCSDHHVEGYVNVDRVAPADLVADLTKAWPWADSSVDWIQALDIIEHLPDKIHTMNEAWRVLKPGAAIDIVVPTTDGRGAFQDPTHVSYWNKNSFWYYEDGNAHRERFGVAYGIKARFVIVHQEETADSEGIRSLRIRLKAVKRGVPDGNVVWPAGTGLTALSASEPRPSARFFGMMRVKNEERWFERAYKSLVALCDKVLVLDDGSTDRTVEIARALGAEVIRSPFSEMNEVRDRQILLELARLEILRRGWTLEHHWAMTLDGDEELPESTVRALRANSGSSAQAMSLPIHYLWNDERTRRVDGVYGNFRGVRAFRPIVGADFVKNSWAEEGLHCGGAPEAIRAGALTLEAPILHYGYMDRADRVRKYKWYNQIDPNNQNEDGYRHMIAGDGPAQPGEEGIVFPSAEERTKHAGPLRLEVVPR